MYPSYFVVANIPLATLINSHFHEINYLSVSSPVFAFKRTLVVLCPCYVAPYILLHPTLAWCILRTRFDLPMWSLVIWLEYSLFSRGITRK